MASIHRDARNRSPYWYAAYTLPDGTQKQVTIHHAHLSASLGYDMLPYQTMLTKRALLEMADAEGWRLVLDPGTADPLAAPFLPARSAWTTPRVGVPVLPRSAS